MSEKPAQDRAQGAETESDPTHRDISTPALLTTIGAQCIVFTLAGLGLWYWSGRDPGDFVSFDPQQLILGIAIAVSMIAAGYALFKGFPQFGDKLVRDQVHNLPFLRNRLGPGAIIALSLCAGISEEALFRGGVFVLLGDYMPMVLALIVSSALFALVHFAKPVVGLLIFGVGAVFTLLYWWTGSLLAVIIGHALYDVWAIWYLQEEMHRLKVFDQNADHTLHPAQP